MLPDLYMQVNLVITVKEKISIIFLGKQFGKKKANLYNRSVLYDKNIDTYDEGVSCIESRDTSQ